MLQSVMVFYGLAVALIAVTVFQTYSDTSKVVTGEATALNALYRDVSSYPEPIRTGSAEGTSRLYGSSHQRSLAIAAAGKDPDRRHRAHEPLSGGAGQIRTGEPKARNFCTEKPCAPITC